MVLLVNNSNHDIFLQKNAVLGHLDYVLLRIPPEVKKVEIPPNTVPGKDSVFANNITSNLEEHRKPSKENQQAVVNKIKLPGFTYEQRDKARQLLRDESGLFFVSDRDIWDVNTHSPKVNLQDSAPVQQRYHPVPKHP